MAVLFFSFFNLVDTCPIRLEPIGCFADKYEIHERAMPDHVSNGFQGQHLPQRNLLVKESNSITEAHVSKCGPCMNTGSKPGTSARTIGTKKGSRAHIL